MNAVAEQVPQPLAESNTVSMFERLCRDPSVDVDKLQRLMDMQERVIKRDAEAAFSAALSEMQCELPSIGERGNAAGRYTYALWEDINQGIKPVLHKHGFAISFRTDFSEGISVTAVLSHRNGHSERTTIKLPADPSGGKNAVQAVASSVSYGKRYTAAALLNLTSHGEDDDAYKSAGGIGERAKSDIGPTSGVYESLTPEQREALETLADQVEHSVSTEGVPSAVKFWEDQTLTNEEKAYAWKLLNSKTRTALRKAHDAAKAKPAA